MVTTNRSASSGSASQPRTKPTMEPYKTLCGKESSAKSESLGAEKDNSQKDVELGELRKSISVMQEFEVSSSDGKPVSGKEL